MEKKNINNIILVPVFLILSIFAIQLYMLTNLGDKGEQLTQLMRKQNELKVHNEILRANIRELQTNQAVIPDLNEKVEIVKKDVIIIDMKIGSNLATAR
jgi:hypothetical protein